MAGFLTTSIAGYVVSRDTIRRGIAEQALPLTRGNIYSEIRKDILREVHFLDSRGAIVLAGKSMSRIKGTIRGQPGIRDVAGAILTGSATPTKLERGRRSRGGPFPGQ